MEFGREHMFYSVCFLFNDYPSFYPKILTKPKSKGSKIPSTLFTKCWGLLFSGKGMITQITIERETLEMEGIPHVKRTIKENGVTLYEDCVKETSLEVATKLNMFEDWLNIIKNPEGRVYCDEEVDVPDVED